MDTIISNNKTLEDVAFFRDKMSKHNFIFSYRGKMSHSMVKSLLSMTEKKVNALNEDLGIKKKIFGVMMSCLQTICSPERAIDYDQESIFMINKTDVNGYYFIYTGIYIDYNQSIALQNILTEINQLSSDSLSDLRKEKLLELKSIEDSFNLNEATLGLINIAKKSGQKINYHSQDIGNNKSFFSLEISIN